MDAVKVTDEVQVVESPEELEEPRVIGPEGKAMPVKKTLILGIEKFRRPQKHYRLIWIQRGEAWLAEENNTRFRRKDGAVLDGQALAEALGVKFSEVTR